MNSSGQMAQITSVDKQPITKNIQQQALLQQQAMQVSIVRLHISITFLTYCSNHFTPFLTMTAPMAMHQSSVLSSYRFLLRCELQVQMEPNMGQYYIVYLYCFKNFTILLQIDIQSLGKQTIVLSISFSIIHLLVTYLLTSLKRKRLPGVHMYYLRILLNIL